MRTICIAQNHEDTDFDIVSSDGSTRKLSEKNRQREITRIQNLVPYDSTKDCHFGHLGSIVVGQVTPDLPSQGERARITLILVEDVLSYSEELEHQVCSTLKSFLGEEISDNCMNQVKEKLQRCYTAHPFMRGKVVICAILFAILSIILASLFLGKETHSREQNHESQVAP